MKTLILFAEQATQPASSATMQIFVYIMGAIAVFAVCWVVYMVLREVKGGNDEKIRSIAIGRTMRYMDAVKNGDFDEIDSEYEKKDAKPKRR